MTTIHVILHPTDFSAPSEHAFHLACALARDQRARLVALHILERPVIVYSGVAMAPPISLPVDQVKALRAQLEQLQSPFPGIEVEHRLLEGDPVTAILQVADDLKCDLIVMGTHGRTGLGRLLIGSVAEQVLRNAKCPVLAMKTPIPE